MEDFIKKGNDIQTITTENLTIQYENMIKEHQKYLYKEITSTIQHYIRGISATEIESLIDRYFLIDLKFRGRETIDNLCEDLKNDINQVIKNSKNKEQNELLRRYFEYINPTIRRILDNQQYTGCTVNFKSTFVSYKVHKVVHNPESEWQIIPNTQEAIILSCKESNLSTCSCSIYIKSFIFLHFSFY